MTPDHANSDRGSAITIPLKHSLSEQTCLASSPREKSFLLGNSVDVLRELYCLELGLDLATGWSEVKSQSSLP